MVSHDKKVPKARAGSEGIGFLVYRLERASEPNGARQWKFVLFHLVCFVMFHSVHSDYKYCCHYEQW
jgi:hypothetical protein